MPSLSALGVLPDTRAADSRNSTPSLAPPAHVLDSFFSRTSVRRLFVYLQPDGSVKPWSCTAHLDGRSMLRRFYSCWSTDRRAQGQWTMRMLYDVALLLRSINGDRYDTSVLAGCAAWSGVLQSRFF